MTPNRAAVLLAALPHALILAWIAFTLAGSEGAYAGFLGILELFVIPIGLLVALAARFTPPIRRFARPIAVTTAAGGLLVVTVAFIAAGISGH
ncbi:hypothetical protein [Actinoplanes sp. NPDC023714]|uniref:hypothetical protein n=1 Tax=Actinoplanes sp. NPDC023714 TaxID=3154322 RepID=UPI0033C5F323